MISSAPKITQKHVFVFWLYLVVEMPNRLTWQQRADIMKARFNLESIPGKGTIIELEFKNE